MKVIAVPKDLSAQDRLDVNQCRAGDLIEVELDDLMYAKLNGIKLFDTINELTRSNIDNFEDEHIIDKSLLKKVIASGLFNKTHHDLALHLTIGQIENLFIEAEKRGTGVFFYF